jgi:hypothetical protein
MAKLGIDRITLANMLRKHAEIDLADRALSLTDDELARIGKLGAYYAFSDDAIALGGSMGATRALSLAAIDVLEGSGRDLRRHHSETEVVEWGLSEEPDAAELARDRELRSRAAEHEEPKPE